jgi:hypothetical protein
MGAPALAIRQGVLPEPPDHTARLRCGTSVSESKNSLLLPSCSVLDRTKSVSFFCSISSSSSPTWLIFQRRSVTLAAIAGMVRRAKSLEMLRRDAELFNGQYGGRAALMRTNTWIILGTLLALLAITRYMQHQGDQRICVDDPTASVCHR